MMDAEGRPVDRRTGQLIQLAIAPPATIKVRQLRSSYGLV